MRRPKNNNLHPINIEKLLGKKLLKNLKSDTPMNRKHNKKSYNCINSCKIKIKEITQ